MKKVLVVLITICAFALIGAINSFAGVVTEKTAGELSCEIEREGKTTRAVLGKKITNEANSIKTAITNDGDATRRKIDEATAANTAAVSSVNSTLASMKTQQANEFSLLRSSTTLIVVLCAIMLAAFIAVMFLVFFRGKQIPVAPVASSRENTPLINMSPSYSIRIGEEVHEYKPEFDPAESKFISRIVNENGEIIRKKGYITVDGRGLDNSVRNTLNRISKMGAPLETAFYKEETEAGRLKKVSKT